MTKAREVEKMLLELKRREEYEKWRPVINVSQRAIDHAVRNDAAHCVIANGTALSLSGDKSKSIGKAIRIRVTAEDIRFTYDGFRFCYETPPHAKKQVIAFDGDKSIQPFKFRLGLPLGVVPMQKNPVKKGKDRRPYGSSPVKKHNPNCSRRGSYRWMGMVMPLSNSEANQLKLLKAGK